ncbi:GH1 family beta-glucosidase [Chitinimonas sp. BJYL2]|uniref:GH1 family beta-glucosidase n=1 Tax=Chitinimonas sp. BJYL2 TaxID=2976696 RepID=UPI0027E500FD|nr:GH1 family beta-glucosidase [Chitinimonas sp. BJYL2]
MRAATHTAALREDGGNDRPNNIISYPEQIKPMSDPTRSLTFPPDFVWGVSTSAFQIEGAAKLDGKGPSIWDRFCEQPGVIADASNGDIACDHYHRWADDLDLIRDLGVDAYRFSICWPRVQPMGHGAWNEKGLDFYERLIDGMLARGLQAHATLNHWDLPQGLQDQGGWHARSTVDHFVEYALMIQRRFGDRLSSIVTHNEPWVAAMLGHHQGIFAPGIKDEAHAIQVSHHLLLSHGRAVQALRAEGTQAKLGIVLNLAPMHPATHSEADRAKARLEDGKLLRWYTDPLCHGHYPADVLAALGDKAPVVHAGDMDDIRQPIDFLGVNYYSRSVQSADGHWDPKAAGKEVSEMGWEVYPAGLTELLQRLHRDYPMLPSLWITENGGAFPDPWVGGQVQDEARVRYLQDHIAAVRIAIDSGVPVGAYMVWSLMDNFEWASGYEKRFGIVHVDYATQQRTLKDSALWYRAFLQRQHQGA